MAAIDNLVTATTTTTGTGNLTTTASFGQTFAAAFGVGVTVDVFYYHIFHETISGEWECGTGHMSATSTLVRDTVIDSSNGGALVDFSAGTKRITNAQPATVLAGKLDSSSYTAADVLAKLLTVDGSGSGIDADMLDGQTGSYYAAASALAGYQPLDADITSWAAITRASGFDTFATTPSSANLAALVTDETGSGALVFATSPTLTTPLIATVLGGSDASSSLTLKSTSGVGTSDMIKFLVGNNGAREAGRIVTSGHMLLGQTSDSVYRLDVVSSADTAAIRAQSSGLVAGYWTTQSGTGTQETFSFNQINISSDDVVAGTSDPTVGFVNGLKVDHYFGGSSAKGGRNAIFGKLRHTTATSASNTYKYYTGMFGWGEAVANDGGGSGTELGVMYGVGALSYLQSGATYWLAAIGCEATAGIATGASAKYRIPLVVNGLGGAAVKGSSVDALIAICNQPSGAKFDVGILFTQLGSATDPVATTGSLVSTSGGATVLHGIDLSGYTFNGGAFKSNGFSVDGLGNLVGKSYLPNANGGGALGSASYQFAGLYLYTGTAINFNNGDVVLTHSSDKLALTGGYLAISLNSGSLPTPSTGTVLHLANADGTTTRLMVDAFGTGISPNFTGRRSRGTAGSPTAVQTDDQLLNFASFGYGATGYSSGSRGGLIISAGENWTDSAQGTIASFSVTANGTTTANNMLRVYGNGSVACNTAAISTSATDGFLYVPTCAGTPTGTPTTLTGLAPIVINTTNNKLYFYSGSAWRDAGP